MLLLGMSLQLVRSFANLPATLAQQLPLWQEVFAPLAQVGLPVITFLSIVRGVEITLIGFYWLTAALIFWRASRHWLAMGLAYVFLLMPFGIIRN